jgi:hypothetical protein
VPYTAILLAVWAAFVASYVVLMADELGVQRGRVLGAAGERVVG